MNEMNNEINGYEKLSPQRKLLIDKVISNMEQGNDIWKQGWKNSGLPESATTHKVYRGMNNFFLSLISMTEGYSDNRWATYHQIQENGWAFKTNEEGKSLAKGKGAPIEFYELRDRKTKKSFNRSVLIGMSKDEQDEYIQKNVYPLRKFYRVFNAELIEGIPQKEVLPIDENTKSDRVESFIKFWGKTESPIYYGGNQSFYSHVKDEIHLPERQMFTSAEQYYSTALHEIGHSTGHISRLNRKLDNSFGSKEYAIEELRAEIASLFMEQDFNVEVDDGAIRNNSAYIKAWLEEIKQDPNVLFNAITDADRIAKFIKEKEKQNKIIHYYSIVKEENEIGDNIYKVYILSDDGKIIKALEKTFINKEALIEELDKYRSSEQVNGIELQEVAFTKLEELSLKKSVQELTVQEESSEYIRPSEMVAKSIDKTNNENLTNSGIESLTRMSDKEVVEKASNVRSGDIFKRLYSGEKVFTNQEKNEQMLMMRISMFCDGDKDRLIRIFNSSGQFNKNKPGSYYSQMAENIIEQISSGLNNKGNYPNKNQEKRHYGINSKG